MDAAFENEKYQEAALSGAYVVSYCGVGAYVVSYCGVGRMLRVIAG